MNSKSLHSDLSLVANLKKGDKKAFEIIFNKYKSKLYFFALKYIHSSAEVEEIIQETFVSLWENREILNEFLSLKNFLYKCVVNKVYNYLKHDAIHQKYMSYIKLNHNDEGENIVDNNISYIDLEKNLNWLVEKLPQNQRNIFKMSRFDRPSNSEIAEKLGISIRTVENQIYKALKFIKLNLKEVSVIAVMLLNVIIH